MLFTAFGYKDLKLSAFLSFIYKATHGDDLAPRSREDITYSCGESIDYSRAKQNAARLGHKAEF